MKSLDTINNRDSLVQELESHKKEYEQLYKEAMRYSNSNSSYDQKLAQKLITKCNSKLKTINSLQERLSALEVRSGSPFSSEYIERVNKLVLDLDIEHDLNYVLSVLPELELDDDMLYTTISGLKCI